MKKLIPLLLALVTIFSLCACGSSTDDTKSNDSTSQKDQEINKVIFEDDYITLTLVKKYDESMEAYGSVGYVMLAENKADKEISFGFEDTSVDGSMVDTTISAGSSVGDMYGIDANKKVVFNLKISCDEAIKNSDDLVNFETTFNVSQVTKESGNSKYTQTIDSKTILIP